jgi:hypothetical protein
VADLSPPWRYRLRRTALRIGFGIGLALLYAGAAFPLLDALCGRQRIENFCAFFGGLWLIIHVPCLALAAMTAYSLRREFGSLARRAAGLGGWASVFSFAIVLICGGVAAVFGFEIGGLVLSFLLPGFVVLGIPVFVLAALWSGLYLALSDRWSLS